ncbi:MAG TPA: YraN family protein [Tenuifilaceae bacterium]|nr:YraN family protein [Tenuifilaceae bacterium]HPE18890.1 YraN family protein [Tenuifilaceae bacterium]HPJ45111.1 YraN family protein [Tenuifilaceae bacterium]HPQ33711.1 YraN family protein [Tenuifilaceae bacterium]HRX68068.1 YraN family protein [Tenuifilaceae bacterium]
MKNTDDLPHHYKLGIEGENLAADFVASQGYKILHKNWRFGKKEIDIVTMKDNMLVVFEVKARFGDYWEEPKDSVTLRKQRNIIEAADAYVDKFDIDMEVQFDIISIVYRHGKKPELEHIPDAFYPTL